MDMKGECGSKLFADITFEITQSGFNCKIQVTFIYIFQGSFMLTVKNSEPRCMDYYVK